MSDITRILAQIDQGDPAATEQLLPLVYDELRKLAALRLAHEKPGQTLQATALVHEAYLRLVQPKENRGQKSEVGSQKPEELAAYPTSNFRPLASGPVWDSRRHFFAAAAEAMRRILVERYRRKRAQKHGGGMERVPLDEVELAAPALDHDLLALDAALNGLAHADPAAAELVKLRFFAGMTIQEAASLLDISSRTANEYWSYAKAWLLRAIEGPR